MHMVQFNLIEVLFITRHLHPMLKSNAVISEYAYSLKAKESVTGKMPTDVCIWTW
jgi:hypothetical protein